MFKEDIEKACEIMQQGGIILYPTDTIWGIGCDATNEEAVEKVYQLKKRQDSKSMLLLTDNEAKLNMYVSEIPDIAWDLLAVSDKPLTIIYPQGKNLPASLLSEDGSIGFRITQEEFSRKLCERFRRPIVSTSANVSGEKSPANYAEIAEEIKDGVDYIVKYRQNDKKKSQPSGIIKLFEGGVVKVIRE